MRVPVLLLCAAAGLAAQSVEGTVVNRVTGTPVDGVKVMLNSGNKSQYETTTDARGAFRLDGVTPGTYNPHLEKRGFIPASGLKPFQVVDGGQPVSVHADMVPMGKLSGRVLDSDGRPVKGASVEMMASFGGPMRTTDANGNFAFEELGPATYTLAARPPKGAKAMELEGGRRVAWIMTYYPGVAQRSGASRITISPGTEVYGQDIRMIAAPVHGIRGIAFDHKGDPMPGAGIELADPSRLTDQTVAQAHSAADGTFQFRDIPAGDWRITASGAQQKASQRLQVGDRDIDQLELRLTQPFTIAGTVNFEGAPAPNYKTVAIPLAPGIGGDMVSARPDDQGKFTVEGVYPGVYQVVPIQPGAQFYLASIRLGERESQDGNVEFSSSALPLSITFRADGWTVPELRSDGIFRPAKTVANTYRTPKTAREKYSQYPLKCDASDRLAK